MILFKREHVGPIVEGRKTQTRRLGERRWRIGSVHQARTRMLDVASCFARIEIGDVVGEALQDLSPYSAWCEGYDSVADYIAVWERINGTGSWSRNPMVHVVCFRVVEVNGSAAP